MIAVNLLLFAFGIPVALIAVGIVWLWLGKKLVGYVFCGG